jgi:hypothetical protein
MYNQLTEAKLKTGERIEVGVIITPDEEYAEKIKPFLTHKGGGFKWHLGRSVVEPLDALETRFYVGKLNGEIITNIMIVEHRHVGILGHVFTTPAQRRKGACKSVMASQMEDFRQRSGEALYLGTGYNSHPYYIYKRFGFESVYPRSGFMKYRAVDDFDARYFALNDVHVKDVEWHDWSKMTALTGIVEGDYLRSIAFGIYGPTNFEGGFPGFKHELENGDSYHDAKLLESDAHAIVGVATVSWDLRWQPHTAVLDLFVHPDFWEASSVLLEAINLPDAKVQCYVESTAKGKADVLENAGFHHEATLKNQIQHQDKGVDVLVFARD